MRISYDGHTAPLPLLGGVVEAQRLVVPAEVVDQLHTYRQACRMAWKLRRVRNLSLRDLAAQAGLYPSHTSDYFSLHADRRELPAKHIAAVESVIGNTVISQWLAHAADLTLLEELQLAHHQTRRAA